MRNIIIVAILGFSVILSACGAGNSNGAPQAVESYITALANKDEATLIPLSCADWEDDARIELDSFQLVEVTVDGMSCQQSGTDGDKTLVDCIGTLNMSYNGEPQSLDLSTRTYEVVNQGGDWLVCGVR
ncbi:MAG: hypothetical protein U0V02_18905 [Anaerolineales bacterium]